MPVYPGALPGTIYLIPLSESVRNGVNLDNAAGRLGATHVLAGAIRKQGDRVHVEATVTDLATRLASGGFSGDLATAQLSTLPVSLAGVVTSSFHLSTVVPARVAAEALLLYLRAVALLRRITAATSRRFGCSKRHRSSTLRRR